MQEQLFLLGILGQTKYNLDTKQNEYFPVITVTASIVDWMNFHDTEIQEDGTKAFLYNKVKYVVIGPAPKQEVIEPVDAAQPLTPKDVIEETKVEEVKKGK